MWKKKEPEEIRAIVTEALKKNTSFVDQNVLGLPASYLDPKVFSQDNSILKDAPFLSTMVQNPNHIGCHTLESSESYFAGTHAIEREVISICAGDILKAESGACDGYIASGGTEANLQAVWIYRNYFLQEKGAAHAEIGILCSSDTHYSMAKAANLLNISLWQVPTNEDHAVDEDAVRETVAKAKNAGIKHLVVVANMMTTMFGSVDRPEVYATVLEEENIDFKLHVDAAFGGFYYPFSNVENTLNFANPLVSSVTLDAHKMAQAPYGTGIFLIRKGFMQYARTKEASYVEGQDSTLIGSRSGANAIAVWMILMRYGRYGWIEKIFILQKRTDWLCEQLDAMDISYYRNPFSNIVTIRSEYLNAALAKKYGLVPDNHENPKWYKIVVMDHVLVEKMELFLEEIPLLASAE